MLNSYSETYRRQKYDNDDNDVECIEDMEWMDMGYLWMIFCGKGKDHHAFKGTPNIQ